jgi:hypothetical protein
MNYSDSIFEVQLRLKFSLLKNWRTKMGANDQKMIKMKDEMDFFTLIERKMEQQGFEVLETLPPDRNSRNRLISNFTYRSKSRFAY